MPKTLIEQLPISKRDYNKELSHLKIAEMFGDTIQGEGINVGIPATFMRLQNCTLDCVWCDTTAVWKQGNAYNISEILTILKQQGMIEKFNSGQHLVLTGGSPLLQQKALIEFIRRLDTEFGFIPYIEVENECVRRIEPELAELVSCWNNSPKLANSGMKSKVRYKPEIIAHTSKMTNSWFKFVVDCEEDWEEILMDFIEPNLIRLDQVILMPCGETQEELEKTREIAANLAVKHNVRFSDRLHVTIWNKQTGV